MPQISLIATLIVFLSAFAMGASADHVVVKYFADQKALTEAHVQIKADTAMHNKINDVVTKEGEEQDASRQFTQDAHIAIAKARQSGDAPMAPILHDAYSRVFTREQTRASARPAP